MSSDIEKIWDFFVRSNNISDHKKPFKSKSEVIVKKQIYCPQKIDLHGYTEDQAYDALEGYLILAKKAGLKKVIVITGKGYSNPKSGEFTKGVLRTKFPSWMQYSKLSFLIKSFKQAEIKDGGDGAFYVFF